MLKNYPIYLLAGLGIFSGSLSADAPGSTGGSTGGSANGKGPTMSNFVPGNPIQDDQRSPGIFNSALYKLKRDHDLFVTADYLWWSTNRPYNDFAPLFKISGTTSTQKNIVHQMPFRSGFKLGVGMGLPWFDQLVTNVIWTRYHQTTATSVSPGAGETLTPSLAVLRPIQNHPQQKCSHIKSVIKYNIDFFEVNAGRPLYISRRFIVNAYFGLKGFYTTQKHDLFYDLLPNADVPNGGKAFSRTKGVWWGIGPNLSFEAKGLLGAGFYLLGKGAVSAQYQKFNKALALVEMPQIPNPPNPGHKTRTELGSVKPYTVTPLLEGGIGFGWNSYFWDNNYHVDLSASYDTIATWLDIISFTAPITPIFVHGYTFKVQLDF